MMFTFAHNALVPFDDAARKWMGDRHVVGERVQVAGLDERQQKFRSFVFMVFNKLAAAAGVTIDEMRARLQIETGRFQDLRLSDGRMVLTVKSMNLLSMSDDDLRSLWKDAKPIIETMLVGFDATAAEEIRQLLEGPQP